MFYWVSESAFASQKSLVLKGEAGKPLPEWMRLKRSVDVLRQFHGQKRQPDNSYKGETTQPEKVKELATEITECVVALAQHFSHDKEYLALVVDDFNAWEKGGFKKPNWS